MHASAYVSIRQAYVSIRQAYVVKKGNELHLARSSAGVSICAFCVIVKQVKLVPGTTWHDARETPRAVATLDEAPEGLCMCARYLTYLLYWCRSTNTSPAACLFAHSWRMLAHAWRMLGTKVQIRTPVRTPLCPLAACTESHLPAYVSTRQHTSAHASYVPRSKYATKQVN